MEMWPNDNRVLVERRRLRNVAIVLLLMEEDENWAFAIPVKPKRKSPCVWQHQFLSRRNFEGIWFTLQQFMRDRHDPVQSKLLKRFLRMDADLFDFILDGVRPFIQKKHTISR